MPTVGRDAAVRRRTPHLAVSNPLVRRQGSRPSRPGPGIPPSGRHPALTAGTPGSDPRRLLAPAHATRRSEGGPGPPRTRVRHERVRQRHTPDRSARGRRTGRRPPAGPPTRDTVTTRCGAPPDPFSSPRCGRRRVRDPHGVRYSDRAFIRPPRARYGRSHGGRAVSPTPRRADCLASTGRSRGRRSGPRAPGDSLELSRGPARRRSTGATSRRPRRTRRSPRQTLYTASRCREPPRRRPLRPLGSAAPSLGPPSAPDRRS